MMPNQQGCRQCPEMVHLSGEIKNHMVHYNESLERNNAAFERVFTMLESVGAAVAKVRSLTQEECTQCRKDMSEKIEGGADKYVSKAEVKTVWAVLATVSGVALWFFSNVQTNNSIPQQQMQQGLQTQQLILEEIKRLRGAEKP